MSDTTRSSRFGRRRALSTVAAAVAVLGMAGTGVAMAASSAGPAKPSTKAARPSTVRPYDNYYGTWTAIPAGGYAELIVTCPTGYIVYGGGEENGAPGTVLLTDSAPYGTTGWYAWVKNTDTVTEYAEAAAVCY